MRRKINQRRNRRAAAPKYIRVGGFTYKRITTRTARPYLDDEDKFEYLATKYSAKDSGYDPYNEELIDEAVYVVQSYDVSSKKRAKVESKLLDLYELVSDWKGYDPRDEDKLINDLWNLLNYLK